VDAPVTTPPGSPEKPPGSPEKPPGSPEKRPAAEPAAQEGPAAEPAAQARDDRSTQSAPVVDAVAASNPLVAQALARLRGAHASTAEPTPEAGAPAAQAPQGDAGEGAASFLII